MYEDPSAVFPAWLVPHPRHRELILTTQGAVVATYIGDGAFVSSWMPDADLSEAMGGFMQIDGHADVDIHIADFHFVVKDPTTGEEVHREAVPWEHLWVSTYLRANDLTMNKAVIAAERDVLVFTTQHLLGLQAMPQQNAGEIVAARLEELASTFEQLLTTATAEEELQVFLRDNPALLDLRAIEVLPKVKLGSEYVTDFVIRYPGDNYELVEIERSSHPLFTQANNPSAALTHAVQQVEDWMEWAYEHLSYLRATLPGIHEPTGLVILGRRAVLTDKSAKALRRRNVSSKIRVLTYDDLLENLRAVAANIG